LVRFRRPEPGDRRAADPFGRGEELDWFSSGEIVIEAIVAASALFLFLVHTFTAQEPFMRPALFGDRNFAAALSLSSSSASPLTPRWRCSRPFCRTS